MFAALMTALFHLVLPLAWLVLLATRAPKSSVVRVLNLIGSALLVSFLVAAGAGWVMLGWYTRWALPVVAAPLWLIGAVRARGAAAWPRGLDAWVNAAVALAVALLMATSMLELGGGTDAVSRPVDIQNPLPAGAYLVMHGGNATLNHHATVRAQRHALDIVGMNGAGFRADGLAPTELSHYAVYGAIVRSPCAGEVLVARDGLDDLPIGPLGEASRKTPLGNTVLIHCSSDITIVLAHLKANSIRVTAGDAVSVGRELGAVGNSGNTTEPHLHLHAVRGRVANPVEAMYDAEPVLLRIDGHIPVRNDRLVVTTRVQPSGASS